MQVVIPFCATDQEQAIRLLKWISELGIVRGHKLWIMPASGIDDSQHRELASSAFVEWDVITDSDGVTSDWGSGAQVRDCSGPNSCFRQIAWHMHLNKLGHWLLLEADCLPTQKGWADKWDTEYHIGGKPFMGNFVRVPKVMDHLTGISMYPQDAVCYAPNLVSRRHAEIEGRVVEIAFDVAGATEVLPQAHITKLIQHCPRHPGFKTMEEVDALLDPNAVLFHMQKDGSLIPFLREKIFGVNGAKGEPSTAVSNGVPQAVEFPAHATHAEITPSLSIADKIRHCVTELSVIIDGKTGRQIQLINELRNRKMIPRGKKRK